VQLAILHLLKEEAMHGYQIMKELEERSNGVYSASAGTVYPALQELLDKNLIKLDIEQDAESDKKIYVIHENGQKWLEEWLEEVAQNEEGDFWVEWKERMLWRNSEEALQLKAAMGRWEKEYHKAMKQARGNPANITKLTEFVDEITNRLKDNFNNKNDFNN
jgi:DNA-binding PadR family transcriptional regulator